MAHGWFTNLSTWLITLNVSAGFFQRKSVNYSVAFGLGHSFELEKNRITKEELARNPGCYLRGLGLGKVNF